MRLRSAAAVAVLLAAVPASYSAIAGAATSTSTVATIRVVVRPVTSTGHARAGFTVQGEPGGQVDCRTPTASPGAVNRNIEWCYPSYEYAIACWKSATPHRVLCMRNPRSAVLAKIPRIGAFAPVDRPRGAARAPLSMRLRNGSYCSIRDGGAWGTLKSHPTWAGMYSCSGGTGVVWAPTGAAHWGVNMTTADWTVKTAPASGVGRLVTRHVKRAFFVGTFSG